MDYIIAALFVLVLFQVKHWYIDFVNQTEEEVKYKGVYLDWRGAKHSLKHGLGTLLILLLATSPEVALALAAFDFLLHYHTDWVKMNYGNRDITTPAFWNHLGLDQMVHQIGYIIIVFLLVI